MAIVCADWLWCRVLASTILALGDCSVCLRNAIPICSCCLHHPISRLLVHFPSPSAALASSSKWQLHSFSCSLCCSLFPGFEFEGPLLTLPCSIIPQNTPPPLGVQWYDIAPFTAYWILNDLILAACTAPVRSFDLLSIRILLFRAVAHDIP